jgi:hypothetical protein
MTPDAVALFATVILLLPMGYFLLAAPAFLLVKLDPTCRPAVARHVQCLFPGVSHCRCNRNGSLRCGGSTGFRHWRWLDHGFRGLGTPLVSAADGCPAWYQACRRCRCGAPAASAALGRHVVQCDPACRDRGQHSLCHGHADLIRFDERGCGEMPPSQVMLNDPVRTDRAGRGCAVHESGCGTSRQFATMRNFFRDRGIADMAGPTAGSTRQRMTPRLHNIDLTPGLSRSEKAPVCIGRFRNSPSYP